MNGRLYVVGGRGTSGPVASVDEYDPATNTWTSRAALPTARDKLGLAAAANGKRYPVGGYNGVDFLATVEEYDPATGTWTARASMPTPRQSLGLAAASNGKLYAVGGNNGGMNPFTLDMVEEYDPATNTWTTKAPM